jgi:hypothetical protein
VDEAVGSWKRIWGMAGRAWRRKRYRAAAFIADESREKTPEEEVPCALFIGRKAAGVVSISDGIEPVSP